MIYDRPASNESEDDDYRGPPDLQEQLMQIGLLQSFLLRVKSLTSLRQTGGVPCRWDLFMSRKIHLKVNSQLNLFATKFYLETVSSCHAFLTMQSRYVVLELIGILD
ncbi:hypothetical protein MKW94_003556 [Papaver nudicaule]|uniref:Uncharacterized protein n=1 Tax=Papaver nudicaule TaxID=74823 RepID=A0AA41SGI0_PAPNU|nr:hypothetical protein [Papaver nudicaule]